MWSLLTSLFCNSNNTSAHLDFKQVKDLGFEEASHCVETNDFWKDQCLSLCAVAPESLPIFAVFTIRAQLLFSAMKYTMLICMEWLIFALDFIWFAEDGKIPYMTLLLWSWVEIWHSKLSENVTEPALSRTDLKSCNNVLSGKFILIQRWRWSLCVWNFFILRNQFSLVEQSQKIVKVPFYS